MFLSIIPKPDAPEYCYHQYLWAYFNQQENESRPFLFRILDSTIIMLSRRRPNCRTIDISSRIDAGRAYQFDLLCSPIRGTYRDDSRTRKRRDPYKTPKERTDWLKRRFGDCAEIRFAQVVDRPKRQFNKAAGQKITLTECVIRGMIYIKDRAAFLDILLQGVGGRGVWGHGLLVLPEVMTWNP